MVNIDDDDDNDGNDNDNLLYKTLRKHSKMIEKKLQNDLLQ